MRTSRPSKPPTPPHSPMDVNRKLRKKVEKSNITAKRVTLLPGFLNRGIKSQTAQKQNPAAAENDKILNEDLPGLLLQDSPPKPRRSLRISEKKDCTGIASPSSYYLRVIEDKTPLKRSKSVFKEIKEKYAEKFELDEVNSDFGARIFAHLHHFELKGPLHLKKQILCEIEQVNNILLGKIDPPDMSVNRKRPFREEDKENYPMKVTFIPQSKWVFQTPPNRKLNYNYSSQMEDNCIKPAVIETTHNNKIIYEMNRDINVDFSSCVNRQEIDIDKRYMMEVTTQPHSIDSMETQEERHNDKKFQCQFLKSDPYELENHFLSLTCRPKKVSNATATRNFSLKRKRDIFEPEPGCSTDMESVNEFDANFSAINCSNNVDDSLRFKFSHSDQLNDLEESFTFKFTSTESDNGATTGLMFDFDGNQKDTFNFFN